MVFMVRDVPKKLRLMLFLMMLMVVIRKNPKAQNPKFLNLLSAGTVKSETLKL